MGSGCQAFIAVTESVEEAAKSGKNIGKKLEKLEKNVKELENELRKALPKW